MVYIFRHFGERTQMPRNECKPLDELLRFIARLLECEKLAPLCREFGISRVTSYKIFDRCKGNAVLMDSMIAARPCNDRPASCRSRSSARLSMVPRAGVEPATYRLGGGRSIH